MSRICELSGKRPITGYNVSKSNRKTKRWFYPNLIKKRFYIPEEDRWVTLKISTKVLRTINKVGIQTYLKKCAAKGIKI